MSRIVFISLIGCLGATTTSYFCGKKINVKLVVLLFIISVLFLYMLSGL